jgi:hypothetical protein
MNYFLVLDGVIKNKLDFFLMFSYIMKNKLKNNFLIFFNFIKRTRTKSFRQKSWRMKLKKKA